MLVFALEWKGRGIDKPIHLYVCVCVCVRMCICLCMYCVCVCVAPLCVFVCVCATCMCMYCVYISCYHWYVAQAMPVEAMMLAVGRRKVVASVLDSTHPSAIPPKPLALKAFFPSPRSVLVLVCVLVLYTRTPRRLGLRI